MLGRSVGSLLDQLAEGYAGDVALVEGGRRQTFAEAIGEMRAFGRALRGQGLRPGDRVALLMTDRRELMTAYYGAMWAAVSSARAASSSAWNAGLVISFCTMTLASTSLASMSLR